MEDGFVVVALDGRIDGFDDGISGCSASMVGFSDPISDGGPESKWDGNWVSNRSILGNKVGLVDSACGEGVGTESIAGAGVRKDGTRVGVKPIAGVRLISIGGGVGTDSVTGVGVRTEATSGVVVGPDSVAGLKVGTKSVADVGVETESVPGVAVGTDAIAGGKVGTDSVAGVEVGTDSERLDGRKVDVTNIGAPVVG